MPSAPPPLKKVRKYPCQQNKTMNDVAINITSAVALLGFVVIVLDLASTPEQLVSGGAGSITIMGAISLCSS